MPQDSAKVLDLWTLIFHLNNLCIYIFLFVELSDIDAERKAIKKTIYLELEKHKIDQTQREKHRLQSLKDSLLRDAVNKPEKELAKAAEALVKVEDYKQRRILQLLEAKVSFAYSLSWVVMISSVIIVTL